MDAQRDHSFQHANRRRDVEQPTFHRPRAEARNVAAFLNNNRAVLMPTERPIGRRGLVEQDRSNGGAIGPDRGCRRRTDRPIGIEQAGEIRPSLQPDPRAIGGQISQRLFNLANRRAGQRAAKELRAVRLEREVVELAQAACFARLARFRSCGSR